MRQQDRGSVKQKPGETYPSYLSRLNRRVRRRRQASAMRQRPGGTFAVETQFYAMEFTLNFAAAIAAAFILFFFARRIGTEDLYTFLSFVFLLITFLHATLAFTAARGRIIELRSNREE